MAEHDLLRIYQYGAPPAHQWPTDWDPGRSDNLISFLDMKDMSYLEAEELKHVEKLSQHTYDEIVRCLKSTSLQEYSHFAPFNNFSLPPIRAMNCSV